VREEAGLRGHRSTNAKLVEVAREIRYESEAALSRA
jgi:hypothetical protein